MGRVDCVTTYEVPPYGGVVYKRVHKCHYFYQYRRYVNSYHGRVIGNHALYRTVLR